MAFNVANYIKNLGKSVAYSAVDRFKETAPATAEFIETNEDLFKNVYSSISDFKGTYKSATNAFKSSKIYETGDLLFKSVIEDISTGKLYNKQREDEINTKLLGSAGSFDELDENFNFDDGSEEDLSGEELTRKAIDSSSQANATMVSQSVARTGQYIVENQKTSTNLLYSQNIQLGNMLNHHFDTLNKNVSNSLQFSNNILKTHAENSRKYFEETTKALQAQSQLLSQIVALMSPSKVQATANSKRQKRMSFNDLTSANGSPDLKEYAKYVKDNIKGEMGNYMPSNPFDDNGSNGNILMTFAASPLKMIPQYIIGQMIPKTLDEASKKLDKSISGFFGSVISKFNVMANNDEGNMLTRMLGKIFGVENSLKTNIDTSKYEKGKVNWTGKSRKALEEVIPTYLSQIVSLLSGKAETRYDYDQGKFVEYHTIRKNLKSSQNMYQNMATSDMRNEFLKYASFLSFQSAEEKKDFQKDMDKFFQALYQRGGFFDINSKTLDMDHINYGVDSKNFKIFRTMFKNTDRYMQQQINSEILRQRSNQNANMRDLEKNGDSVYNNLFNGSNEMIGRKDNGDLNDKKNPFAKYNLANTKDNKGHNVFYYLQNMYKELSFIRRTGGMGNSSTSNTKKLNPLLMQNGQFISSNNSKPLTIEDILIPDSSSLLKENRNKARHYRNDEDRFRREKERNAKHMSAIDNKILDISNLDDSQIDKQLGYIIQRNNMTNKLRNRSDKEKKPSLIDQLLESNSIADKTKVIVGKLNDLSKKPLQFLTNTIDKVDQRLYEVIYGTDDKGNGSDPKGFLNMMVWKLQKTFSRFNDWLDNTILNPIKKRVNKENVKKVAKNVLGVFGIDADEMTANIKTYFFGNKKTGETGLFSSIGDGIKNSFKGALGTVKDAFKSTFGPTVNRVKAHMNRNNKKDTSAIDQLVDTINNEVQNTTTTGYIEKNIVGTSLITPHDVRQQELNQAFSNEGEYRKIYDKSALGKHFTMVNGKVDPLSRFNDIYNKYKPLEDQGYFNKRGKQNTEEYYRYQTAKRYLAMQGNKKPSISNPNTINNGLTNLVNGYKGIQSLSDQILNPFSNKNVVQSGETGVVKDFSSGLAKVISEYITKNIHPHAEGSDEIKKPEIATLSKGEKVVKASDNKDSKNLENLMDKFSNSSAGKNLGSLLGKLSDELEGIYQSDGSQAVLGKLKGLNLKKRFTQLDPETRKKVSNTIKNVGTKTKQANGNDKEGESIVVQAARETYNAGIKAKGILFGEPGKDSKAFGEVVTDVSKNMSKYAPDAIGSALVGGGVSLVTGAIGGPLLGAAVGAGISLAKSSDKVKDWLFGEMGENGEREGGVITKKTQDVFKKFFPDIKKLGIVGGVSGLLPFVPFGPVGGLMIGAGVGFLKNTEVVQERMFGKGGIIDDKKKAAIKKAVPRTLAALVPSLFLGPFGLLGNAVLGTGLGLLSNTKTFEKSVFGTYNLATKKNENGLLPLLRDTMVNPIRKFYNRMANTLFDWVKDNVMKPVESAIKPLGKQIELTFKSIASDIGKVVDRVFEKTVGVPMSKMIEGLQKKITGFLGGAFNLILKPVKAVVSAPFKAIGALGNAARKSQIRNGTADYMTAEERNEYRRTHDMRTLGQKLGRFSLGNKIFGKLGLEEDPNGFKNTDDLLESMSEEEIDQAYQGINTIRDSRKAARDKRVGAINEVGNQVSGYVDNYGLAKKAMKGFRDGDLDTTRKIISDQRAREKGRDAQVINKLNDLIQNKNSSANLGGILRYIDKRVDDPKTSKEMENLARSKDPNDLKKLYELIKKEEKRKDKQQLDMIKFINEKAKDYEQSKNQQYSQQDLEKQAYDQLSNLGFEGINKNNAQQYLDLLSKEKKDRQSQKSTVEGADDTEVEVKIDKGIQNLTDQEKEQHQDIMKVISDALNTLKDIKKSVVTNDITEYDKSPLDSVLDADLSSKKFRKKSVKNRKARKSMSDIINGEAEKRKKEEDKVAEKNNINPENLASQNYSGGVIKKTGIGSVSKNEYVFTPEQTNKMMGSLPNILQNEAKKKDATENIQGLVQKAVDKLSNIDSNTKDEDTKMDKPITKIDGFGNVMKFNTVRNGDLEPDRSDSNTVKALSEATDQKKTQKGILDKLSGLSKILNPFSSKDKDQDKDKKKTSIFSKLLSLLGGGGILGKLGLLAAGTAAVGGTGLLLEKTGAGKELESLWDKKFVPWMHKTGGPWLEEKGIPAIVNGIHTALIEGMPLIVKGIASSMKFAITKLYPALLKAVQKQLGMSGDDEASIGQKVAYTTGKDILANGGNGVTKFAEKYGVNGAKDVLNEGKNAMPKAGDILTRPLSTGAKLAGNITKTGAKVGTSLLGKATSIIAKPIVGLEHAVDNAHLFGKLPSLAETSSKITEKGLNSTIGLSEAITKKAGVKAASATEQAAMKGLEKTASSGLVGSLMKDFQEFLLKILGSSPVVKLVGSDGAEKLTTKFVPRFLEAVSKQVEKKGTEVTAKLAASASTAGIANIVFAVQGFISGFNNSRSILGITDQATMTEKIATGLMQAIMNGFIITSLIPPKLLVTLAMDIIMPLFGESSTKLQKQREAAKKKVADYNKKHKTNYSIEQYNKKVQGDTSLWEKFKNGVGTVKNGIVNNATYVKNQVGKGIDFVKEHGVVGTMGYIADSAKETVSDVFNAVGKKISPLVDSAKDLLSYGSTVEKTGMKSAWDLSLSEYWKAPDTKGEFGGLKKFLFYSNRIVQAPVYGTVALGRGIYKGVGSIITGVKNFGTTISSDNKLVNDNIDKNVDNSKYWSLPDTSKSFLGGFEKTIFATNRILHAPQYYLHKLLELINPANWVKDAKDAVQKKIDDTKDSIANSKPVTVVKNTVKKVKDTATTVKDKAKSVVDTTKSFLGNMVNGAKSLLGAGGQSDIYLTPAQYKLLTTNPKYIKNPDLIYRLPGFNTAKTVDITNPKRAAQIRKLKTGKGGGTGSGYNNLSTTSKLLLNTTDKSILSKYGPHKKNMFSNTKSILTNSYGNSKGIGGSSLSGFATGTASISPAVEAYRSTIDKYKGQYGVNDTDLVLALIQQESGGTPSALKTDPMQSSESLGLGPGALKDPTRSIQAGLKLLGENLARSGGDIPISLQAYNFGGGFIDYVKSHGGKFSQNLVDGFANAHGGAYGDRQYVAHVLRYYKGDGSSAGDGTSSSDSSDSKPTLASMFSDMDTMFTHAQNRFFGFDDSTDSSSSSSSSGSSTNNGVNTKSATPVADWFKSTMGGATETSPYGPRKGLDASGFHAGIDMSGAKGAGSPIKTPVDGTVAVNQPPSESGGFGNAVYVKDKNGNYNVFGHMQQRSKLAVGSKVKQGDLIGYEGSTGHSTGPHLHYEVRKSLSPGTSVNPDQYLKDYYKGVGGQIVELAKQAAVNAKEHPEGKENPVKIKQPKISNSKLGKGGATASGVTSQLLTSLINGVIAILTKIADNTSNLSNIVKILSTTTGANVSQDQLKKLDTSNGKTQVANAIKDSLIKTTDPDSQLNAKKVIDLINQISIE